MPIVEQRNPRDGNILAIVGAVAAFVVLLLLLAFVIARPARMVAVTVPAGSAPSAGSGSGSWGVGSAASVKIPDGSPKGVSIPVGDADIPATARITDVVLKVQLKHPHPQDLRVSLISPSGARSLLRAVGTTGQLQATYSGLSSMASLIGGPGTGKWRVQVVDERKGGQGTVESLDISLQYAW